MYGRKGRLKKKDRCWVLGIAYWMLDAGNWVLGTVTGYWLLDAGL